MDRIKRIPVIEHPELIDKVLGEIQVGLAKELPWLKYAFGRAQRMVKEIKNKKYTYPGVYYGKKDYLDVSPDDRIGNFSFFVIDDPQTLAWEPKSRGLLTAECSLIFWVNLNNIPGIEARNTEKVKSDILKALNGGFTMRYGRIEITRIYEQAENIYRGFTIPEVETQYLMHPYAGFRFSGRILINESC